MAARRLIPLLDRVLVQKVEATAKSAGGLLLPETAAAKGKIAEQRSARGASLLQVNEGVVIAVGPGRRVATTGELLPPSVKEGDKVLLPEYGGSLIKLGGADSKEFFLYRDEELLGILKD